MNELRNTPIPHFFDGFYNLDDEEAETLGQAFSDFETAVHVIKTVTNAMRNCDFEPEECAMLLNHYYGGDFSAIPSSSADNYYYVLSMPQLRELEFALESIERDVTDFRQKTNRLKKELWQLLPDFYKGSSLPWPQPLTYHPEKPYPHLCIEGSLAKTRQAKLHAWGRALEDQEKISNYLPDDLERPTTIAFQKGDAIMNGQTYPLYIHWTEMHPFDDMLSFAEDVLAGHDPTSLYIDPEGDLIWWYTARAGAPQNVKYIIYYSADDAVGFTLNRRQLAQSLIQECEIAIKNHTNYQMREHKGYFGDINNWRRKISRLKAVM